MGTVLAQAHIGDVPQLFAEILSSQSSLAPDNVSYASSVTIPDSASPEPLSTMATPPPSEPKAAAARLCGVCEKEPGKYKCPRCTMPYCSVACNRTHKENHPPDEPKIKPEPESPGRLRCENSDEEDKHPLRGVLKYQADMQRLFHKYPGLDEELDRLQRTTLPPSPTANGGGGGGGLLPFKMRQQPMWSRDIGLRRGVEALRKARCNPSELGDGVREFCDLILFALANEARETDATELVRQDVAAEEAKTVERLLREETEKDR